MGLKTTKTASCNAGIHRSTFPVEHEAAFHSVNLPYIETGKTGGEGQRSWCSCQAFPYLGKHRKRPRPAGGFALAVSASCRAHRDAGAVHPLGAGAALRDAGQNPHENTLSRALAGMASFPAARWSRVRSCPAAPITGHPIRLADLHRAFHIRQWGGGG